MKLTDDIDEINTTLTSCSLTTKSSRWEGERRALECTCPDNNTRRKEKMSYEIDNMYHYQNSKINT